jgi:DNA polymerase-3 subunit delta
VNQQELRRQIAQGGLAPLYYFYGQNIHLVEETIQSLKSTLYTPAGAEFDVNSFDAESHDISEMLTAVQTPPMQSQKRLVVVKRTDVFKAAQWEQFVRYLTKPSLRCCLIFTAIADKPAVSEKYLKLFQSNGTVVLFENPKKGSIGELIRAILRKDDKTITSDALQYLIDEVSSESQVIHQELEKLLLYCIDKKTISRQDVEATLSSSEQQTIFALVDAIGLGDKDSSITILNRLLENGVEPLPILGMIARQLRLLAVTIQAVGRGEKNFQIAASLNEFNIRVTRGKGMIYNRQVESLVKQAKKWTLARIGMAAEEISLADMRLKSSRIDKRLILEHLILQLE